MSTLPSGSSSLISLFTLVGAFACSACAPWTPPLTPRGVQLGQGALFGRVQLANNGSDVTDRCFVIFTNEREVEKGRVRLDDTGWVFIALGTGRTLLSNVTCNVGGAIGAAGYSSKEHAFDVLGGGKIVYFGHFLIDLHADASNVGAASAIAGPIGGLIAAAVEDAPTPPEANVLDRLEEAKNIYESKYGADASVLQPVVSIAGRAATASGTAPTIAAGFELRKEVTNAEASCVAANHTWHKIDDTSYSCDGPAAALEVPVTVGLMSCGDKICRVALNGNSDSASWSVVLARFTKLRQSIVRVHGNAHERAADPLDDCKGGLDACLAAGRVRTSAKWSWPDGRSISIMLDGGPPGGVASLTLVYGTGESAAAKP